MQQLQYDYYFLTNIDVLGKRRSSGSPQPSLEMLVAFQEALTQEQPFTLLEGSPGPLTTGSNYFGVGIPKILVILFKSIFLCTFDPSQRVPRAEIIPIEPDR